MSSPVSSFYSDEVFSATSGSYGSVNNVRRSLSGSPRPSPTTTGTPNALVGTLKDLASFYDSPPAVLGDVSFHLSPREFHTLLEALYDQQPRPLVDDQPTSPSNTALRQAFPDPQHRREQRDKCVAWLDTHRWDYRASLLSFRMPTEIHDGAAHKFGIYIQTKFRDALAAVDPNRGFVHCGMRTITYDNLPNRATPDVCLWLEPDDSSSTASDISFEAELARTELAKLAEPRRIREVPGLVLEVGWSHPTRHEQCIEYITHSKGNTRCVISIEATYVPPQKQETTALLPEMRLNAWRFVSPPDAGTPARSPVEHFIQNQVIWRYESGPPETVESPRGAVNLTLGDLSSDLRHLGGPSIQLQWSKLRSIFQDAYARNRGDDSLKRMSRAEDYTSPEPESRGRRHEV